MPDDTSAITAAAVALKLPPFYTQNAQFWFVFIESQFHLKNITADDTKFSYVVTSLSEEVAMRVMPAIQNPPDTDKYNFLKTKLLKEFSLTDTERAAALLDLPGMGDLKPTQLLTKMVSLLPDGVEAGFLFRELFLRQLPSDVRTHLIDKGSLSLEDLATEADKFFTSASLRVAAVRPRRPDATNTRRDKLCYFHVKFGAAARRCRSPCSYVPEN